jgi:phosphoglycolate phosphatase-like HAD superfamily hydrolase
MKNKQRRILLFDIDGTLLDPRGEVNVFRDALIKVFGTAGPIDTYDMAGKTDWRIITDLMHLAGVEEEAIERKLLQAFDVYAQLFAESASELFIDTFPGVFELVERIIDDQDFVMGLVTGNVRELVPHKLRSGGLDPVHFPFGAYGSENIDRNVLPTLALNRLEVITNEPASLESVLIIGDTPHDVSCARHTGVKVMCVATGTYSFEELAASEPDYLLEDFSDTEEVMRILYQF